MNIEKIEVRAGKPAKQAIAHQAAQLSAQACLSDCEFCVKVLVTTPIVLKGGKYTPQNCKVRTTCALQPKPVKPPQAVMVSAECPIRLRAQEKKTAGQRKAA